MSFAAVLALSAFGCKQTTDTDRAPTAEKQVEQAQKESAEAYDRAKSAQENAAQEAREAARAQDDVEAKRQALTEAEQKAAASAQEAQQAQESARAEGDAAHQEAQQAQDRAAQAQQTANQEIEARRSQPPMRTTDTTAPDTRDTRDTVTVNAVDTDLLQQQINEAIETAKNTGGSSYRTDDSVRRPSVDVDTRDITRPLNPRKQ
jgi:hypothetical protein